MKKNKLNINLDDIFKDTSFAYEKELGLNKDRIEEISIDMIRSNPYQPRKKFDDESLSELADSIKTYGILQPIVVIYDEESVDGGYILIAGERRLRACKKLGFELIKAYVGKFPLSKLRELALIENLQRENLNPIELALSYDAIIKHYGITQEELSKFVSKSRTQITNTLRLLTLSDETRDLILKGVLSQGHAKVIVGLSENDEKKVVKSVIGQKLSVKETESLIRALKNNKPKEKKHTKVDEKYSADIDKLVSIFDNNKIHYNIKSNKIEISLDDIKFLLNLFN